MGVQGLRAYALRYYAHVRITYLHFAYSIYELLIVNVFVALKPDSAYTLI